MPSPDEFASLLAGRRRYPIDDPITGYSAPNDPAEPGVAPYMAAAPQFRPAPRTGQSIQEMLDQIRQRQQEFHAPVPTVSEQIGDILSKTGQVAKGIVTAPVNAVANLYGKVAEEHNGSLSLSSDDYRDPNAMAHDPEVPATALGLMGASVPFSGEGSIGMAGGKLPSLTPAIRYNGKVYSAPEGSISHMEALEAIPLEHKQHATLDGNNRVYVTQNGRVLDRWRAQDFANKNELFSPSAPNFARSSPELIAEWLAKKEESNSSFEGINDVAAKALATKPPDL